MNKCWCLCEYYYVDLLLFDWSIRISIEVLKNKDIRINISTYYLYILWFNVSSILVGKYNILINI